MKPRSICGVWIAGLMGIVAVATGCASKKVVEPVPLPTVAPEQQPGDLAALPLDPTTVEPMYTEVVPIDLATVLRVAHADNLDILESQQWVEVNRGRLESAVGEVFPVIMPTVLYQNVSGRRLNTDGQILNVGFDTWAPGITVEWVINPGKVIYEIIAAKKRLAASEHQAFAVVQETTRRAANEFYELVLDQARVAAARQGVEEAEELLRIEQVRFQTSTGIRADVLRADARLAERRQDLVSAINRFYQSSVTLALTLRLDSTATLVPSLDELPPVDLVRDDFSIEELMEIAVAFRPDLKHVREMMAAAVADRSATWWSGFGPGLDVSYYYGGLGGHANNVDPAQGIPNNLIVNPASPTGAFSMNPVANGLIKEGISRGSKAREGTGDKSYKLARSHRFASQAGWRLSLAAFGELKTAGAMQRQALIDAERNIDQARADVVLASQLAGAQRELITMATQQVEAAEEALRLTEANLQAGTMTTLDVLQAQDAATQARLRYAEAVVRFNQSEVNLLAALGLADESTIVIGDEESQPLMSERGDDEQG
ncbi:MAG: TolC family protein [Planctomycetota bacterium]|jgi:outer membrane protein TolC